MNTPRPAAPWPSPPPPDLRRQPRLPELQPRQRVRRPRKFPASSLPRPPGVSLKAALRSRRDYFRYSFTYSFLLCFFFSLFSCSVLLHIRILRIFIQSYNMCFYFLLFRFLYSSLFRVFTHSQLIRFHSFFYNNNSYFNSFLW